MNKYDKRKFIITDLASNFPFQKYICPPLERPLSSKTTPLSG